MIPAITRMPYTRTGLGRDLGKVSQMYNDLMEIMSRETTYPRHELVARGLVLNFDDFRRHHLRSAERNNQTAIIARAFLEEPLQDRLKRTALSDMKLILTKIAEVKKAEEDEWDELEEMFSDEMGAGAWS